MNKNIFCVTLITSGSIGGFAFAGSVNVEVNLPRLAVAEYHRPYVSAWVEDVNSASKGTLFVWYDAKNREDSGRKWLKDMRAWWRKGGRDLNVPADGITSATRAPGRQNVKLDSNNSLFKGLGNGNYVLCVEAARESGGREVVKVPFVWNGNNFAAKASGSSELGQIVLSFSK